MVLPKDKVTKKHGKVLSIDMKKETLIKVRSEPILLKEKP